MNHIHPTVGKFLYSVLFLVVVPAGIWLWAEAIGHKLSLPAVESIVGGGLLFFAGILLLMWGMYALWKYGKGLPMNAYPPPHLVSRGPFRIFRHPLYTGFAMLTIGWFMADGQAAGFWIISPLVILSMVALVLGYEAPELKHRFPDSSFRSLTDVPENSRKQPDATDRFSALFWVLVLIFVCNGIIVSMSGKTDSTGIFYYEWLPGATAFIPHIVGFLLVIIISFVLKNKYILREWIISVAVSAVFSVILSFIWPETGAAIISGIPWPGLSVPIIVILISCYFLFKKPAIARFFLVIAGLLLVAFRIIVSQEALFLLIVTLGISLVSVFHRNIWQFLRIWSEKIANSWHEWVFGKIRVINHGFYVGFGAFLGILLAGILAGREYALALLVFAVIVTICSALWAQIIEGSARLKRPFGFYGGLVGIFFGSIAVWAMGLNAWVIIGVSSVVMPWVQAIGRLRCLVNGCCHGCRVENPNTGIRYFHPRSRVNNISGLNGELLHPTQLYSILWLTIVGVVMLRLWNIGLSSSFIFGLYLILTGIGRFVEEAYRGESQTPVVSRLRLYQWTAIASIVAGIVMTVIDISPVDIVSGFSLQVLAAAIICGLFIFFAMGVDFPYSNRRFSRLV
jgi:protein-S-isoprenylcysteine O-methyltransferase Ste14